MATRKPGPAQPGQPNDPRQTGLANLGQLSTRLGEIFSRPDLHHPNELLLSVGEFLGNLLGAPGTESLPAVGGFIPGKTAAARLASKARAEKEIPAIKEVGPLIEEQIDQIKGFIAPGPGGESFREFMREKLLRSFGLSPKNIRPAGQELSISQAPQAILSGGGRPPAIVQENIVRALSQPGGLEAMNNQQRLALIESLRRSFGSIPRQSANKINQAFLQQKSVKPKPSK